MDDILDLQFIATMPSQSQKAEGFVPISAVFALDEGHPFKGVRVRASENAIEVKQIPGSNQANIAVNSCKDCIGKKFFERGQAQPGQPGCAKRISPRCCGGSSRRAASEASPTIRTGSI